MNWLMQHTIHIMIGYKALFIITVSSFLFQSCGLFQPEKDICNIAIQNKTLDTLIINFYNCSYLNYYDIQDKIILPKTISYLINNNVSYEKEENPIEAHFDQWSYHDSCWVYYYDNELRNIVENQIDTFSGMITPNPKSLRIFWKGPFREMGDSVNNFFNKQSWRSEGEYEILFTISESDYNVKK
jgi:hypothetical protein